MEFLNSGKFRVNFNGGRMDVWLIFRCKKCRHSWNLPIHERVKRTYLPPEELEHFLQNDPEWAQKYGGDPVLLKRNGAEIH